MIKVLITGPESSGKSTLTAQLSAYFKAPFVKEFAREYLAKKPKYQESDLLQIAIGQQKKEELAEKKTHELIFCDTGAEVIKIWSQEKYGRVHSEILALTQRSNYDIVLLCKPNILWSPDPLRENPTDRDRLFELYVTHFSSSMIKVFVIDESLKGRLDQSIKFLYETFPILKKRG